MSSRQLGLMALELNYDIFSQKVFRRDSRKLPIGDPDVDWEETIYLNLIVHQLEYTITLAICSRTSPKDLQVPNLRTPTYVVIALPKCFK